MAKKKRRLDIGEIAGLFREIDRLLSQWRIRECYAVWGALNPAEAERLSPEERQHSQKYGRGEMEAIEAQLRKSIRDLAKEGQLL